MRALAVAISSGVFAISLALPGLILAQDTAPAPSEEAPAPEAAPPQAPPGEEAPPPADVPPVPEAAPPPEPAAGAATAPPAPVTKASASVTMADFSFSPASVTVNVGDSVSWTNTGAEDHTATGSGFGTGTVVPGSGGSATFSTGGTFSYVCDFHPEMKGTVNVVGSGVPSPGTDPGTGIDPVTGAPLSEEAAGALPGAAGSANGLPSTGETEAPLLILGAGLLGCGALAAALARWRAREATLWPAAF